MISAPARSVYQYDAIRRDETLDNLHSIYVDQWDWERVITPEKRNVEELKFTVQGIVLAICDTLEVVKEKIPPHHNRAVPRGNLYHLSRSWRINTPT